MKVLFVYPRIMFFSAVIFGQIFGTEVVLIWFLYSKEVFGWAAGDNSVFIFTVGLAGIISQVTALPLAVKHLGEKKAMYSSFAFHIIGDALWSAANKPWQLYAIILIAFYGFVAGTIIRGDMSRQVHKSQQGQLSGALSSLTTAAQAIGGAVMSGSFSYAISDAAPVYLPSIIFILAVLINCIGAFFLYRGWQATVRTPEEIAAQGQLPLGNYLGVFEQLIISGPQIQPARHLATDPTDAPLTYADPPATAAH